MSRTFRIVVQIANGDPFWVQVREAVDQRAKQLGLDIVTVDFDDPYEIPVRDHVVRVEELLAQEVDAVVCLDWPENLARETLRIGIPIVQVSESDVRDPLFVSMLGLRDIARDMGHFLAQRLEGHGRILTVGGLLYGFGEDGKSRVAGLHDALHDYPEVELRHVPSLWTYESAYEEVRKIDWAEGERFDALFGFSDSLALGARDAGRPIGLVDSRSLIVGINGDPLALAEILGGTMTATVQTSALDIARQAVDLALTAARRLPLPAHFGYNPQFVTADNVGAVAAQKLTAIASLPSRLIGDNRRQAHQRLAQLETSLRINQQLGGLLDRHRLHREIADLIRDSYQYDTVLLYLWDKTAHVLYVDDATQARVEVVVSSDDSTPLAESLHRNEPIFIPDVRHSHRFEPDPNWRDTVSRVIVPIRLGTEILGLLDLHSRTLRQHARQDLIGLQALADQTGMAMRNAELYGVAVHARAQAEKADQLKTRLLANVSHELRTPLNVILGYASTALAQPNPYDTDLPDNLRQDLKQVFSSGEHLLRLINDLLDLSRAEIGELDLYPERISTRTFLEDTLRTLSSGLPARPELSWRFDAAGQLPEIEGDPVRLRQVLYNLLSNAYKFTLTGEIVLGAAVVPPHLHVWVRDTGTGIPMDLQERIFEPFVTSLNDRRRAEGVGLGLTITRRLVLLHGGLITLESQPGQGSTFHLYLPLPTLGGGGARAIPTAARPIFLVIGEPGTAPEEALALAQRNAWAIAFARSPADLEAVWGQGQPVALAWDLGSAAQADWGLIERIRALPQLATLPFLLYASEAADVSAGVAQVLLKPFDRQSLVASIQALAPQRASGPVLIVDDDPQARQLYADVIAGHFPDRGVVQATDGEAAIRLLDEQTPCLVILDLMMPRVDGFEVLDVLRSRSATQRVPVIVLSGKVLTQDDIARLSQPRVQFQTKDLLSEDELAEALRRALEGTEALPQPTSTVVKRAIAYLHQHYGDDLARPDIAAAVGVSEDYLSRIFRQEVGLSPWDFLNRYRVQQAKTLLRASDAPILHIAGQVGFSDLSYFNRVFRKYVGRAPTAYRRDES